MCLHEILYKNLDFFSVVFFSFLFSQNKIQFGFTPSKFKGGPPDEISDALGKALMRYLADFSLVPPRVATRENHKEKLLLLYRKIIIRKNRTSGASYFCVSGSVW